MPMTEAIQKEHMEIDVSTEFNHLIAAARRVSVEAADTVGEILESGLKKPLSREEAAALLGRVVTVMHDGATQRGDKRTAAALSKDVNDFIMRVITQRDEVAAVHRPARGRPVLQLQSHDGIQPQPVRPSPVFHEREVAVRQGFVRTRDIQLWDQNERLDIHLSQFRRVHGRGPTADDLLEIMLGQAALPGATADQFQIKDLARSIAVNGVRKPPVIDVDGTLLDGNRRVSACHFILDSEEFDAEEKRRAEWLQVWQLTEHATQSDREAVIVSLNFEPDYKQDWPPYVKARKVHAEWQARLAREPRANSLRQKDLKRELSKKFALGPETGYVNRYIQMVELADEFEDYQVSERKRDKFEVKHKAERYFQYFDELGKGKGPGGVNYALNQDEPFKHLVYDLLFDGKFSNWNKIRDLKYVATNEEALAFLREARDERDVDRGQSLVDDGCSAARMARAVERSVNGNKRIESFVNWLESAPVKIFRPGASDSIRPLNLRRLYGALKLVEGYLGPDDDKSAEE
jgi:hypothetical protein